MAYAIAIGGCDTEGCAKAATFEVYAYNDRRPHGRYCAKHAEKRVTELTAAEATNPEGFRT